MRVTWFLLVVLVGCHPPAARRQLDWLRGRLADGGRVDEAAVNAHFTPGFLERRPPARVVATLPALAGHLGGMTVREVTTLSDEQVILHGVAGPQPFALTVATDPASGRIEHLDVGADIGRVPGSMDEAVTLARGMAPRSQLLVAALEEGRCRPLVVHNEAEPLAIASTFKLYLLLALADRIAAGEASWQDELAVRDDWKSLPSGVTQDDPAGTRLPLRVLADRMIAISDNTASDHLLYHLGREAVEGAVARSGHADPARNVPFLGTRELFWLKMAVPPAEAAAWATMTAAERRVYLDGIAGRIPTEGTDFTDWKTARHVDTIEWFAGAADLCRLAGALWRRAQDPRAAALLEVLSQNGGLNTVSRRAWPYVGFKGGSEPGVASAVWLLRRADGRWFVVVLGLNGNAEIDEGALMGLATGIVVRLQDTAP